MVATEKDTTRTSVQPPIHTSRVMARAGSPRAAERAKARAEKAKEAVEKEKARASMTLMSWACLPPGEAQAGATVRGAHGEESNGVDHPLSGHLVAYR